MNALEYKLETPVETYCSISREYHTCESVFIIPPFEYLTKSSYKKPAPRLKKNKIKTVESFLRSRPTISELESQLYRVVASTGFYFQDNSVRISDLKGVKP